MFIQNNAALSVPLLSRFSLRLTLRLTKRVAHAVGTSQTQHTNTHALVGHTEMSKYDMYSTCVLYYSSRVCVCVCTNGQRRVLVTRLSSHNI